MFFKKLSVALLALPAVVATGIIFPLYIYPGTNCASWSPVLSSITSHPSLSFTIVINPATQMNSHANVVTVGYVSTQHGSRSASAVTADINTYAGWGASYRPKGIFFDEASSGSGDVSKYSGYASTARSALGSNAFVVLNPGTAASSGYYPFSSMIITAENFYSSFRPKPKNASSQAGSQQIFQQQQQHHHKRSVFDF
ncbi:hypothetical protein ONZ45_g2704 [Pleurotus djamor]|nr:hypothetical protein ONZ45_g2704 [Pleurotus djamor]